MNSTDSTATDYRINFMNESDNSGSIMLFQKNQDINVDNVSSLAWLTKKIHPQTFGYFDWTTQYYFVWAETGVLKPGIQFLASQMVKADFLSGNSIGLTYVDGAYSFGETSYMQDLESSINIQQDGTVPLKSAAVGIGMAGSSVAVVPTQPNINLTFTPTPEYWIAFGDYTKGQVLSEQDMTNGARVNFPAGVTEMTAILRSDNTWDIIPN